jgi:hypothetical protein
MNIFFSFGTIRWPNFITNYFSFHPWYLHMSYYSFWINFHNIHNHDPDKMVLREIQIYCRVCFLQNGLRVLCFLCIELNLSLLFLIHLNVLYLQFFWPHFGEVSFITAVLY